MGCFGATTIPRQVRKRDVRKSPVRANRTPGSVRGAPGNRRPYLDRVATEFLACFLTLPSVRHGLASKMQGATGRQRLPSSLSDLTN